MTRRQAILVAVGALLIALIAVLLLTELAPHRPPSGLEPDPEVVPELTTLPVLTAQSPMRAVPATPVEAASGATGDMVRVLVERDGQPSPSAIVQLLRLPRDGAPVVAGEPRRVDELGIARFAMPESDGHGSLSIEAMQLTSSGYERVLVALDEQAVRDAATQTVVLPIGGSLVVDLSGLPADARPEQIEFRFFPATVAHSDIVGSVPQPVPDIGLQRLLDGESLWSAVDESGESHPIEIPADHVVVPRVEPTEPGWTVMSMDYSGPRTGSPWAWPVLAVRADHREVLEPRWARLPLVEVRVLDQVSKLPADDCEVWVGVRPPRSSRRRFAQRLESAGDGWHSGFLSLGDTLPGWSVEGSDVVAVVTGQDYRTELLVQGFSWSGIRQERSVTRSSGLGWVVRGRVTWTSGTLASNTAFVFSPATLTDNQFPLTTDAEGRFEIALDEHVAPLFFERGYGLARLAPVMKTEHAQDGVFKIGFVPDLGPVELRLSQEAGAAEEVDLVLERRLVR